MEEISKPQMARLVLGYLKKENYKIAYNYFYKQCPHFEKYRQKKFKVSTRYNGLALEDILRQYSEIYSIVQPRLEDTEYFEDRSFHKEELPQQLQYLLDYTRCRSETTSSPASPASIIGANENDTNPYITSMEMSASLDVSSTPLQTLPGNSIDTHPKCSKPMIHNDTETERDESSSGEGEKAVIGDVVEVFKETLLAHEEWQQRIAHTINEVRNADAKDMLHQSMAFEVESAIKAIVDRTATDPTFESLVEEILGPVPGPCTSQTTQPQVAQQDNNVHNKSDGKHMSPENVIVIDSKGGVNSQQVMMNSNNLLMLKPQASTPCNIYISTPPGINLSPQGPPQYNLSEQDIMSMPVFVCDEKHEEKVLVEQGVQVPEKRLKTLMPVRRPLKAANALADYITLYKCDANEDEPPPDAELPNLPSTSYATIQVPPLDETIPEKDARVEIKTPEHSAAASKAPAPTATPRSGNRSSHIRALDFKFSTPAKDMLNVTHSSSTSPKTYVNKHKTPHVQKSSKSLFNAVAATPKLKEPWDMKYRSGLSIHEPTPPDKRVPTKAEKKAMTKSPNENVDSSNKSPAAKPAKATKKKTSGKKAKPKPTTTTSPSNANQAAKVNETTPISNKTLKSKILHSELKELKEMKEDDVIPQNCIKLININKPPVFHRKCNIENKREVKVAIPQEPKLVELVADSDKLVLSPSKLNGSKRSLVEMEVTKAGAMLTPEVQRVDKVEPMAVPCSSTMRNITPLLETPGKDIYPKTPCVYSPSTAEDTPLTKVFKEHMTGVDISSIPTPKMLLTPSFPFTPFMEANHTPLTNRPTDYSTSSSYYQPSDTEQNKSLEKLIKECQRLENEQEMGTQPGAVVAEEPIAQVALQAQEQVQEQVQLQEPVTKPEIVSSAVVEKIKTFGNNVIARKNLNLIKGEGENKKDDMNVSTASTGDSSSSTSSSSSSSSSNSSRSGSDFEDNLDANETVVEKRSSRYSLRSSSSSTPKERQHKVENTDDAEADVKEMIVNGKIETCEIDMDHKQHINDIVNNVEYVPELKKQAASDGPDKAKPRILSDLELKKQRVLEGLKNDSAEKATKRSAARPPPKKRKQPTCGRVLRSSTVKLKEEDLFLTSSDEEGDVRPFELVETELLGSNSNTPLPEATLKEVGVEKERTRCIANSPEHDMIIAGAHEEVAVDSKDAKESKKSGSNKKGAKSARKSSEKSKSARKPAVAAEKATRKPTKPAAKESKSKASTKKNAEEQSKVIAQQMQKNIVVIEPTPVPEITSLGAAPESAIKRELKGTTGPAAKKLVEGLMERGIKLIENPNPSRFAHEATESKEQHDDSLPKHAQTTRPFVFCQSEEKLGKCISTINTPEEDLIHFDIKVFTEPLLVDGSSAELSTCTRDYDDDNLRLKKSYAMTVYDDTTDAEIKKVMHVTAFECVFEYRPAMKHDVKPSTKQKTKVKVLNNVLIKKEKQLQPLQMLHDSLISNEKTSAKREIQDCRNSPLESLYEGKSSTGSRFVKANARSKSVDCKETEKTSKSPKTEVASLDISNNDKKRKAESSDADGRAEKEDDTKKKIKLDDQRLLQEVDVDDLLAKFYG